MKNPTQMKSLEPELSKTQRPQPLPFQETKVARLCETAQVMTAMDSIDTKTFWVTTFLTLPTIMFGNQETFTFLLTLMNLCPFPRASTSQNLLRSFYTSWRPR